MTRAYTLAESQFGVVSRAQLVTLGMSEGAISHRVRTGQWSIPLPGTYDLHAAIRDARMPWEAVLTAAQRAHPGECAAVLSTAGRIWGLPYCNGHDVDVRVRPGLEQVQRPGIRFHTWDVWPIDIVQHRSFLTTAPTRTVADLLLHRTRDSGVAILDAALHLELVSLGDFTVIAAIMGGRRGCRRARTYLPHAAVGAQSPLETRIRLIAIDAGMAPDGLQVPIRDGDGRLLGYGDIGWRTSRGWLIAECDGLAPHSQPRALAHDRRRQNEMLMRPGVTMIRFTWADASRPTYVANVIRRARAG